MYFWKRLCSQQCFIKLMLGVLATLTLMGCSHKTWYGIGQNHDQQKCLEQRVEPIQECLNAPRKSYEEYKKDREAILKHKG